MSKATLPQSKWGLTKVLYTVKRNCFGKIYWNFKSKAISPASHVPRLHPTLPKVWTVSLDRHWHYYYKKWFFESLVVQTLWGAKQSFINLEVLEIVWPKPEENI